MSRIMRKPLSFTTTLRNPERIPDFLECILPYENRILTDDVIHQIVRTVIAKRYYNPINAWRKLSDLKQKFSDPSYQFQNQELDEIIEHAPQKHKEAGFSRGWPSRFDTWYKFIKELGLVYYEMNQPIQISDVTKWLFKDLDPSDRDDEFNERFRLVFLNCLVKYHTDNPFRRNLNKNQPVPLLLKTLSTLKSILGDDYKGIAKKEICFFICWNNNSATELAEYILNFRKEFGINASDEVYYEKSLILLDTDNTILRKMSHLLREGIDDYIRKIRLTGLITLRGGGFYIDINSFENERCEHIIQTYEENLNDFKNEVEYYQYASTFNNDFFIDYKSSQTQNDVISSVEKWVKNTDLQTVKQELKVLSNHSNSTHEIFKYINQPARFEFLISLFIKHSFSNVLVVPQYKTDDEGLPTSTAGGNVGDIKCIEEGNGILIEVTMVGGRQQTMMEIWPIERHLEDFQKEYENVMCHFIAPSIFRDSTRQIDFVYGDKGLRIMPRSISDFVDFVSGATKLWEVRND